MPEIRYQISDFICDSHISLSKYAKIYDTDGEWIGDVEISFLEDVEDLREAKDKLF